MSDKIVEIASQFSRHPGGRYKSDGEFSGEEFRDDLLLPALELAISENDRVCVVLDGTAGYASSFLEEVFGGLVRSHRFSSDMIRRHLAIVAKDPLYETYKGLAEKYFKEAASRPQAVAH